MAQGSEGKTTSKLTRITSPRAVASTSMCSTTSEEEKKETSDTSSSAASAKPARLTVAPVLVRTAKSETVLGCRSRDSSECRKDDMAEGRGANSDADDAKGAGAGAGRARRGRVSGAG